MVNVSYPQTASEATAERMVQFFFGRADVLHKLATEAVRTQSGIESERSNYSRAAELTEHMQGMWNGGYAIHFLLEAGQKQLADDLALRLYDVAESGEYSEWTYDLLTKYDENREVVS